MIFYPHLRMNREIVDLLAGAGLANIVMPRKEFMAEHKHLISLLNKYKQHPELAKEAASQEAEMKSYKGGFSKQSGFIRRMMAENALKHKGQYRRPTDPLHPGSTMNKPVPFEYEKLATPGQKGKKTSGNPYGASPFIQKHFGTAEFVPFERKRGQPLPTEPFPNKKRGRKATTAPAPTAPALPPPVEEEEEEEDVPIRPFGFETGRVRPPSPPRKSDHKAENPPQIPKPAPAPAPEPPKPAEPPKPIPSPLHQPSNHINLAKVPGLTMKPVKERVKQEHYDWRKPDEFRDVPWEKRKDTNPYPSFGNLGSIQDKRQLMVYSNNPYTQGWNASWKATWKGKPVFVFNTGDMYEIPEGEWNLLENRRYLGYVNQRGELTEPTPRTEYERGIMGVYYYNPVALAREPHHPVPGIFEGIGYAIYEPDGTPIDPMIKFRKLEAEAEEIRKQKKAEEEERKERYRKMGEANRAEAAKRGMTLEAYLRTAK